jgi:hypothetical protein
MIVDSALWIHLSVPDRGRPHQFRHPAFQFTRSSVEQQSYVDACNQRNIEQEVGAPAYAERPRNNRCEIRRKNENSGGKEQNNRE